MAGPFLRQFARAPLTLSLLLGLIVLEGAKHLFVGNPHALYAVVGLSRSGIASMELWQLFSYSLFHGDWIHLMLNGLLLLAVGSRLEWMIGRRRMARVLTGGVLAGGLLHLLLSPNVLIGVSGGMMALLLCHTTLSPESRWLLPLPVSGKSLGRGLMAASLLLSLLSPDYGVPWFADRGRVLADSGLKSLFEISHGCHLGGAVVGWLGARWLLRPRVSLSILQRERARRETPGPDGR